MTFSVETRDSATAGWLGRLELGFEPRGGRTVLAHRRRHGPLSVQRPFYPGDGACHVYLLHPPGGVVGGDRLEIEVAVGGGAHALITAPGAAKLYRSAGGEAAVEQRFRIEDGGVLEWLPHEGIFFPGARVCQRTRVELSGDARFLGWEIQSLGRPAVGEHFAAGAADLGLTVLRHGRPLLAERLRLRAESDLGGPSGLRSYPVTGTLVATGATEADLEDCRETIAGPPEGLFAATRLDDLLVARCLSSSVEPVHRIFRALWRILRPRLLGRGACPPRIWAT